MRIKVAHLVRQYYPSVGGMEEVVQNIARHQRDYHDHVPTIITLNRLFRNSAEVLPPEDEVDGIRVVRLPYRGSSRYPLAPSVLRHVRNADVIHVHAVDFFYDYLALTKTVHRRPLVASTHGGFFHTEFASRLKKIYFNTITRASSAAYDRIVGTSENDGMMFRDIVHTPKLSVIENGVNVQKFAGRGAQRLSPVMIYFGRWSVNKGLVETLALLRELVIRHPEWQLIIAGREYDHSEAELNALVEQHGLTRHVRLVPNPAERELAELIAQASYYVCLSRHEGFGIAPIEGMSAGLTPVLSDIPPFRNLVEKSGMGVLVDIQHLDQAAAQIASLHAQGEDAYVARRGAAQHFVQQYDWRHIADRYVQIYHDLVGGERVAGYA
jgi:alpha-1,3-mannosyltransferase